MRFKKLKPEDVRAAESITAFMAVDEPERRTVVDMTGDEDVPSVVRQVVHDSLARGDDFETSANWHGNRNNYDGLDDLKTEQEDYMPLFDFVEEEGEVPDLDAVIKEEDSYDQFREIEKKLKVSDPVGKGEEDHRTLEEAKAEHAEIAAAYERWNDAVSDDKFYVTIGLYNKNVGNPQSVDEMAAFCSSLFKYGPRIDGRKAMEKYANWLLIGIKKKNKFSRVGSDRVRLYDYHIVFEMDIKKGISQDRFQKMMLHWNSGELKRLISAHVSYEEIDDISETVQEILENEAKKPRS